MEDQRCQAQSPQGRLLQETMCRIKVECLTWGAMERDRASAVTMTGGTRAHRMDMTQGGMSTRGRALVRGWITPVA
eukprot:3758673-Amphidinium_carterae.1